MKKAILHLLIIVVAFNGISGIAAADCDASASWKTALHAESSLVSLLFVAIVPSSIINKLVSEEFPLAMQFAKTPSRNAPAKEKKQNNNDQTLGILSEDSAVRRYAPVTGIPLAWLQGSPEDFPYYCSVESASVPLSTIIIFLLAYLVILSRIHLPSPQHMNINLFLKPCPSRRTGFHHLRRLP